MPGHSTGRVRLATLALATAVALLAPQGHEAQAAAVHFVPADFPTIQAAVDAAADGDEIRVSPGTYVENVLIENKNLLLVGADPANPPTIDGNAAGTVVMLRNTDSEVSGFVITNGNEDFDGSGVGAVGGSPTIRGNVITGNVGCSGVGVSLSLTTALVVGNEISDNRRTGCSGGSGGAGMRIGNSPVSGPPRVIGNVFVGNVIDSGGGGLAMNNSGNVLIEANLFYANQARWGGGIEMVNGSTPLIVNNLFLDNVATSYGGAISWITPSGSEGPDLINNTFVDNVAPHGTAIESAGFVDGLPVVNNVIVGDGPLITCSTFGSQTPTFSYNDVFATSGNRYSGICADPTGTAGNVSADPQFAAPNAGPLPAAFRVKPSSPVIDAGTAAGAPADDIVGTGRPIDGDGDGSARFDMGAFEFVPGSPNDPPIAVGDGPFAVSRGGIVKGNVLANDSDPNGDSLTALLETGPAHGTVDLKPGGAFTYDHDGSGAPSDSFVYRAYDGEYESNPITVRIDVELANRSPVARDDGGYLVTRGGHLRGSGLLDNDSDPEGDPLEVLGYFDAVHGDVVVYADGTFDYTHDGSPGSQDSFRYVATDGNSASNEATVTITVVDEIDTVGLVDPSQGQWHLRNTQGQVTSFFFGNPGDIPFMGDWDCDGVDTPGLFRQSDAFAYLSNANRSQVADIRFFFGDPNDVPIAGDFDGDGCDSLGIYRPSEQRFYIVNKLGANNGGLGRADFSFGFGNPGDTPVVGDWDADGIDEVGLYRESTGFFYWRNVLRTGIADGQIFFGDPGDRFVAGDWGLIDGKDTPAVFRPSNTTFYFRFTLTQGNADASVPFGEPNWLPVAGLFGLG